MCENQSTKLLTFEHRSTATVCYIAFDVVVARRKKKISRGKRRESNILLRIHKKHSLHSWEPLCYFKYLLVVIVNCTCNIVITVEHLLAPLKFVHLNHRRKRKDNNIILICDPAISSVTYFTAKPKPN